MASAVASLAQPAVVVKYQRAACSFRARKTRGSPASGKKVTCMAVATTRGLSFAEQKMHTISNERLEVVKSLNGFVEKELLPMLLDTKTCWQPADFLPDPSKESFYDEVRELREASKELPDEYFVCLVGDTITEEALPTYQTMLNTLDGTKDETGASNTPWAIWTRAWTAEENRHGDLLNKYLYLTGRVDMRKVEVTIQNLIGSGMDPKTENNPYLGYIYTSFQERATKVSHGNTARHAKELGNAALAKMCGLIAADEGRHEVAYQRIVAGLFERDPEGAMMGFADMMRKQIVMPAHLMDDGEPGGDNLFDAFSKVAQRTGVYTAMDYVAIMEHLIKRWGVADLKLTGEAAKEQEYVMKLPTRFQKLAERTAAKAAKESTVRRPFSWIYNREVKLL